MLFYDGPVSSTKDIDFAFEKCVDVKRISKQNVHGKWAVNYDISVA